MNSSRGLLIAGNWKMNRGPRETREFFTRLGLLFQSMKRVTSTEVQTCIQNQRLRLCIAPPALSLQTAQESAQEIANGSNSTEVGFLVQIAAQNAHWEQKGAFTGEISGPMLNEIGIQWAIVGHSERRQFFGETDHTVYQRTLSLLQQNFQVILCIGETQAEREAQKTETVLTRQIEAAIQPDMSSFLQGQLILAYEPVWAIGTGVTATPEQAEQAHGFIRDLLRKKLSNFVSEKTPILYGGSVTPENIDSLLACPNIDGALVGGASLKPESFLELVQSATQAALRNQ